MLKEILSISGKSGLFKLVSRTKNMLIVESLLDGKRSPAYSSDKVVSLNDIAILTQNAEIKLNKVLKKLFDRENGKTCQMDTKSDNQTLKDFMSEIVPDFDRNRVYPSDIRKLIIWYNILINAGITNFEIEKEEDENTENTEKDASAVTVKEKSNKVTVKQPVKVQEKKMQTTKQTRTKV